MRGIVQLPRHKCATQRYRQVVKNFITAPRLYRRLYRSNANHFPARYAERQTSIFRNIYMSRHVTLFITECSAVLFDKPYGKLL